MASNTDGVLQNFLTAAAMKEIMLMESVMEKEQEDGSMGVCMREIWKGLLHGKEHTNGLMAQSIRGAGNKIIGMAKANTRGLMEIIMKEPG